MECGFAWLAPLLWRFDKDWKGVWREVPWVKRRPSEYVREHFRFTTAPAHLPSDPAALHQVLEMLDGPGMLAYASDYPHRHGDGLPALHGQAERGAAARADVGDGGRDVWAGELSWHSDSGLSAVSCGWRASRRL